MKKFLFLAAALIAMGCGISSCSNEAELTKQTEQTPKLTKLTFTVAQDAQTRVAWGGANNRTPMFETGDKVSLFSEHNTNVMLTASVDAVGNVTLSGEGISGDDNLYFVYPYDANARYYSSDPGMIYGNASSEDSSPYNYDGSNMLNPGIDEYPSNAFSLATSTDGGESAITFKGLTTIIKFTPTTACKGFIYIDAGDDVFPLTGVNIDLNESKIIGTLTDGISLPQMNYMYNFEAGKSYYFALPAFTMASGGYIEFVDNEYHETQLYKATADKDFVAGKIYSLKYGEAAPSIAKWELKIPFGQWFGGTTADRNNVTSIVIRTGQVRPHDDTTVQDLNIESTLWSRYDNTNNTAYIETSEDVIQATSLSSTFSISTTANLQSISGLENIDVSNVDNCYGCFQNCAKLTELDVSSWQIKSGANTNRMFYSLYALTSLTLNNTFHAGENMFKGIGYNLSGTKCKVYGVTDNAVKTDLEQTSPKNTGWTDATITKIEWGN